MHAQAGQNAPERPVVQERQVEHHRQEIEESVVAGERDECLQQAEEGHAGDADAPESGGRRMTKGTASSMANITVVEAVAIHAGALVRVPADPRRDGLRLVVVAERRQSPTSSRRRSAAW